MTWWHRSGVVTARGARVQEIVDFLDARGILAIVESHDAAYESLNLRLAVNSDDGVASLSPDATIDAATTLDVVAQELADHLQAEVSFGAQEWIPSGRAAGSSDPFEQPLGADIASFAERAVVFTRAPELELEQIAAQVEDVIYAVPHLDGHALCITEGPVLSTLEWHDEALPVIIFEEGGDSPAVTSIPATDDTNDPLTHVWGATRTVTPSAGSEAFGTPEATRAAYAFVDTTLGIGALVRELMIALPAVEPGDVRAALDEGLPQLLTALNLPTEVGEYLAGEVAADELDGATEVQPASFARSVRRAVSEASTTMTERTEAMRARAIAVRTRAETAFDAAEAFAEDVVIPVHRNWVSPALAVAETTLGVLALRKARRSRGFAAAAFGTGGVVLLIDAAVNATITVAPLLRRTR